MPKTCFFSNLCDSGTASANRRYDAAGQPRPSLFVVNEERLQLWREKVPKRVDNRDLRVGDFICSKHFFEDEIVKETKIQLADGSYFTSPKAAHPVAGAIPHIFGPYSKRKASKSRENSPPPKRQYTAAAKIGTPHHETPEEVQHRPATLETPQTPLEAPQACEIIVHEEPASVSAVSSPRSSFSVECIHKQSTLIKTPGSMWGVHTNKESFTVFSHMTMEKQLDKTVTFKDSLQPEVLFLPSNKREHFPEVTSIENLESLLKVVARTRMCIGVTDEGMRTPVWSPHCLGKIVGPLRMIRCPQCGSKRRNLQKKKRLHEGGKEASRDRKRAQKLAKRLKAQKQKSKRQHKKILSLKEQIHKFMDDLQRVEAKKVEEIVMTLPPEQQPLVRTCFEVARRKPQGRRYAADWLYDCLLMKIQSPKLYRRLRQRDKMPLPSETTLLRMLRKIRPVYGFSENVFTLLKEKSNMFGTKGEKHGFLLIDEMSIEEAVAFQKHSLQTVGLVDLDKFTPAISKNKRGDHALVLMFQPFKGGWVQAIAAFLSAGAVPGATLQKIILEAIRLMEGSGYFVDGLVSDAATWNRAMWDCFGISKESSFCQHPIDPNRKLHIASDFPHLVKNLWARIAAKKEIQVNEGTLKLSHWEAVIQEEERRGIRRAFSLTRDHLDPTNYQKMNVSMAMRFFGHTACTAMESYHLEGLKGLEDCAPTIAFMKQMNLVIDAMNSQTPVTALKADPLSTQHQVLLKFMKYMEVMDEEAYQQRKKEAEEKAHQKYADEVRKAAEKAKKAQTGTAAGAPKAKRSVRQPTLKLPNIQRSARKVHVGGEKEFTSSTFLGLWVTVRTALNLCKYLTTEVGFSYLMTRKINQDALEHFFGHVRAACGSNNHPDAIMFINIFRLLQSYSLVKPPRGSNVSGEEMINTLFSLKDLVGEKNEEKRKIMEEKIDLILDGGLPFEYGQADDHNYLEHTIDPLALTVLGGYVSRRLRKMKPCTTCDECYQSVCKPEKEKDNDRETLLNLRSYGGYLKPSQKLYDILFQLEQHVIKVTSNNLLHSNTFFHILDSLVTSANDMEMVGCENHKRQLTSTIVSFFLTCRMHFICAETNKKISVKTKRKNLMKLAKLIKSMTDNDDPQVSGVTE